MTAIGTAPGKKMVDETRVHYREFHNIFVYITERCQLRCGHCYMGDRLERGLRMSYAYVSQVLVTCRRLGAEYVTFLGGEPTLHPDFPRIVDLALTVGYRQIMIDSNGLLPERLKRIDPKKLHYVSISLDGASPSTHDKVRGKGTFARVTETIRVLASCGYAVRINCTIFQFNVHEAPAMLALADELGVQLVNFHTFSEEGYGIANAHWSLQPHDWIAFYESLQDIGKDYRTAVWYPPTWATPEKVKEYAEQGFRGCLGCSLDRLSIFPDGRCYVCSVLFDKPYHFATLGPDGFALNKLNNEFELFAAAAREGSSPEESGCPAERILVQNGSTCSKQGLISMCRCWKSQV